MMFFIFLFLDEIKLRFHNINEPEFITRTESNQIKFGSDL